MPRRSALEDLEDLQARQRHLQAGLAQVLAFHARSPADRSHPSRRRSAIRYHGGDYPPTDTHAPTLRRARAPSARGRTQRLRLSPGHPAGQLPGRQVRRPAAGRHDAHPGALPAGHADGAGYLRPGSLGLSVLLPARAAAPPGAASPGGVLQGGQGGALRARQRPRLGAGGARSGSPDLQVPEDLAAPRPRSALHTLAPALTRIAPQRAIELDPVTI